MAKKLEKYKTSKTNTVINISVEIQCFYKVFWNRVIVFRIFDKHPMYCVYL